MDIHGLKKMTTRRTSLVSPRYWSTLPDGSRLPLAMHAFLPDYTFKGVEGESKAGTSTSGIVGGLLTLAVAAGLGFLLSRRRKTAQHA